MVMTPPASNTGPVDTIEHETANDALTNHNARPDMFVMDEQHATAADEDGQLPDDKECVEYGLLTTPTCPFPS